MTQEQPYTVIRDYDTFELRHYPDYVLIQVTVQGDFMRAGSVGFGPLVSYISGNNARGQKIAMTAPVLQETKAEETHTVSFVLPEGMDIDTVPVPLNSRVVRTAVPAHDAAVLKFGGGWSDDRFQANADKLIRDVSAAGLSPAGNPYFARFDPPWKPWFLRRNEVLVAVAPSIL